MRHLRKVIFSFAVVFLMCLTNAYAYELEAEPLGYGEVYITGKCAAKTNVSLMLAPAGTSYDACMSDPSVIMFLRQVKSGNDGSFAFYVKLDISEDTPVQAYVNTAGGNLDSSLLFTIMAASAYPDDTGSAVLNGTHLTVKTTSLSGYRNKKAAVAVIRDGKDFDTAEASDFAAFAQILTGENGEINIILPLNTLFYQSGDYMVYIKEEGQNVIRYPVTLYGADVLGTTLAQINAANEETMLDALVAAAGPLGHDEILSFSMADNVAKIVAAKKPFASFDDVVLCVEQAYEEVNTLRLLLIDINAAASARRWADIEVIIKDTYASMINADLSKLNEIKDTKAFFLEMCSKTYTSLKDILDAYDAAYNACKNQGNSPVVNRPAGVGGGGGGGGFSAGNVSSSMTTDVVKAPATPELKPELLPEEAFTDIDGVEWAKESINYFRMSGAIRGYGDGTFRPNENITREEFVKFLISAFAFDITEGAEPFTDEKEGEWYCKYLSTARLNKIAVGNSDGSFSVGAPITRADLAVMAYRAAKLKNIELSHIKPAVVFDDFVHIPDYSLEIVSELQQAGIINGRDNNLFDPHGNATRAEAAKIVYGLVKAM